MKQSNERIVTIADGDDYNRQTKNGSSAIRLKQQTRDDLDATCSLKDRGTSIQPEACTGVRWSHFT